MKGWLHRLLRRPPASACAARWVVVDCETSGLDADRDSLISIAGVGVTARRISPKDSFSALLRQEQSSRRDNILVHGIGQERQRAGQPPATALSGFFSFAAESPRVAFPAAFDPAVLARASRGMERRDVGAWLDLAELLPLLFRSRGGVASTLDAWLASFGIAHALRHDALGDAYATAQLFQIALSEASVQGFDTVPALLRAPRAGRWTGA